MSSAKESATPSADVAQKQPVDAMGDQSTGPEPEYGDQVELSVEAFKYNNFNQQEKLSKKLHYHYWFFLAIRWSPGHASFIPIRKDMATLWGVDFPATHVSYPEGIPLSRQKMLFFGVSPDSPSLCEIKTRARGFKEAIAQSNATSIIKAVTEHAPTLLHKAAVTPTNKDVELLKLELKTTHENLQQTRKELHDVRAEFSRLEDMVKAVCDTYTNKIAVVEMETSRVEERAMQVDCEVFLLGEQITTLDRRVDKVTDTSALVLSILTAPGGEKREREEEEVES
ncbi:hypothetical protein CEP53_010544 [Fusarium sp. AF-6]|nr:hypothetical protein CEP53_010544 [Fusarium sp. AF-6]